MRGRACAVGASRDRWACPVSWSFSGTAPLHLRYIPHHTVPNPTNPHLVPRAVGFEVVLWRGPPPAALALAPAQQRGDGLVAVVRGHEQLVAPALGGREGEGESAGEGPSEQQTAEQDRTAGSAGTAAAQLAAAAAAAAAHRFRVPRSWRSTATSWFPVTARSAVSSSTACRSLHTASWPPSAAAFRGACRGGGEQDGVQACEGERLHRREGGRTGRSACEPPVRSL